MVAISDPGLGPSRTWMRLLADGTWLAAFGLIFLVTTDALGMVLGGSDPTAAGPIVRMIKLGCYGVMIALTGIYAGHLVRAVQAAPEIALLLALATASTLWSVDPGETIERLIPIFAATGLAMVLGQALSLRGLLLFLALLSGAIALVSFMAIATIPAARGTPPWDTVWRGIFNHKNGLGLATALGALFSIYAAMVTRGLWRWVFIGGAVLALALLAASFARTSQIIGGVALLNLAIAYLFRERLLTWATVSAVIFGILVALIILIFATGASDAIFQALGRKPTMSGRIPLWTLIWPFIEERYWLGYGYAAFWDPEARRVIEIARDPTLRFTPFYSHNGLIEMWLALGLLGVALGFAAIGRALMSVFASSSDGPTRSTSCPPSCSSWPSSA